MQEEKKIKKTKTEEVVLSNDQLLKKITMLQTQIDLLKKQMKPIELPKMATLHECNTISRKNRETLLKAK